MHRDVTLGVQRKDDDDGDGDNMKMNDDDNS